MRRTTEQRRRRARFLVCAAARLSRAQVLKDCYSYLWLSQTAWTHACCICMPATMASLPSNYPEACELQASSSHAPQEHLMCVVSVM